MNKIIATSGKFEIIHADHINLFRKMRFYCGREIGEPLYNVFVFLNSDISIEKYTGRPALIQEQQRKQVLKSIQYIQDVIIFHEEHPHNIIREYQPAIWAKGGDYDIEKMQSTPIVRAYGGKVITIPHKYGIHSSDILEQFCCSCMFGKEKK